MVIPTANQANKPVSGQNVNPEKQTFSSVYVAAGDNENLNAANVHHDENYVNTRAGDANVPPPPVYVPVKAANGRKKRSGWCLAGTFGAGMLVALIIVALTVVLVQVFCGNKKSGWVSVDDEHKCHEHKRGDDDDYNLRNLMRGKRPYMEPGIYVLEWMEIENGIWGIDVPNFGHDASGSVSYHYSIVVDFHKQLAAIKVGDSTNSFSPECFVGHTYDLGMPEQQVVEDFLGEVREQLSMHVDKMQYYYFEPVPLQAGRRVGSAIEQFCSDAPILALEPVVAEIKEQVEEILELYGSSYEDMGELVDDLVESSVELLAGDRDKIKSVLFNTEEILSYVPHLPSGKYSFEGKYGVAVSLNIRRSKREEMELRKNLWARLEADEEYDDDDDDDKKRQK